MDKVKIHPSESSLDELKKLVKSGKTISSKFMIIKESIVVYYFIKTFCISGWYCHFFDTGMLHQQDYHRFNVNSKIAAMPIMNNACWNNLSAYNVNLKLKKMNEEQTILEKFESITTISSREIAEITGKRHAYVMRDISEIESAYMKVYGNECKFALVEYIDGKGEKRPEYQLNKSQAFFLLSGYYPALRIMVNRRVLELEKLNRASKKITRKELAQRIIDEEEAKERQMKNLGL